MNNNIRTNKIAWLYFPNILFKMQNKLRSNTWFGDSMYINSNIFQDMLSLPNFICLYKKLQKYTVIICLLLWIILVPEIKPPIPLPAPEPKPKPEPGKQVCPQC